MEWFRLPRTPGWGGQLFQYEGLVNRQFEHRRHNHADNYSSLYRPRTSGCSTTSFWIFFQFKEANLSPHVRNVLEGSRENWPNKSQGPSIARDFWIDNASLENPGPLVVGHFPCFRYVEHVLWSRCFQSKPLLWNLSNAANFLLMFCGSRVLTLLESCGASSATALENPCSLAFQ